MPRLPLPSLAVFMCLLLGTADAASPDSGPRSAVTYAAPAGNRPAGHPGPNPYVAILPSGRIVKPFGRSVVVGMQALGVALSPDGRFAVVADSDERESDVPSILQPGVLGGYGLTVVDTQSMRVVEQYRAPDETYFAGIAVLRDPANPSGTLVLAAGGPSNTVYAFTLDAAGRLAPDAKHLISMPGPIDPAFADEGHAYPEAIALSPDGSKAYVVNELAGSVSTIDTATRTLLGKPAAVGFFPWGIALTPGGAVVTNEGLMRYARLPLPVAAPQFATVAPNPAAASSLSVLPFDASGALGQQTAVPLDGTPDGLRISGGAHPSAVVTTADGRFAFVAMAGVDRIATVALGPVPRAVGGTELRLFDRGPYGTQPDALALTKDGRRLYVALAGLNAIAVIDAHDPVHLHRLGLIPTGWYPSALALSADDRTLYVTNAKGFGHDRGFTGDRATHADSNAVWSTLERIDVPSLSLASATRIALESVRAVKPAAKDRIVPQSLLDGPSSAIKHVVLILEENKTYDAMLGDLTDDRNRPYGPGDPAFTAFGATVTPNLHALARTYGVAGNFFSDAEESDAGHQFAAAGIAGVYTEKTLLSKSGRSPLVNKNEDPEDYPRAGYIFNALARHGLSYRNYGDFIRLSGYDEGNAADPKTDDLNFAGMDDARAPTAGLGGLYTLDVPAPLVLGGHTDLNYPGWNLRIRDERRAREFLRDFDPLVRSGRMPAYTHIWLPNDHGGFGRGIPPLAEEVADGDRALGLIVDYLSHTREWKSTAIFVMPDDAQSSRDHIDEHRSYAVVISPYAKRHYIGKRHISTVSVLKTEEELLGLAPLSLGDLLASDMADFFTPAPNLTPYSSIAVPTQTASREGERIAALLARTDQSRPDADGRRQARLIDLSRRADALAERRDALGAAEYERRQAAFYTAALSVVR